VQIVFGRRTVHVPAKSKTDKTRHHQPGSSYHHPMRIFEVRRQPLHEMKFTQKFVAGVSSPHLTVDGRKISLRAAGAHDQADRDAGDQE
jgi:hypothetical protein